MFDDFLLWLGESIVGNLWRRWFPRQNPVQKEVEDAQAIQNSNVVNLHDGDSAKLLQSEWSKPH
jgi:hypothetical protein